MKKKKIKPCSPVSVQPWKNKRQAIKDVKDKQENQRNWNYYERMHKWW